MTSTIMNWDDGGHAFYPWLKTESLCNWDVCGHKNWLFRWLYHLSSSGIVDHDFFIAVLFLYVGV